MHCARRLPLRACPLALLLVAGAVATTPQPDSPAPVTPPQPDTPAPVTPAPTPQPAPPTTPAPQQLVTQQPVALPTAAPAGHAGTAVPQPGATRAPGRNGASGADDEGEWFRKDVVPFVFVCVVVGLGAVGAVVYRRCLRPATSVHDVALAEEGDIAACAYRSGRMPSGPPSPLAPTPLALASTRSVVSQAST